MSIRVFSSSKLFYCSFTSKASH